MKKFILIVICNIVLLSLIVPLPLHAQTQPEPRVIHTVTKDNKDHLGLSILFTFVDSNNQPLSTDDVKDYREGTIQLTTSQSSPVTATIQPATTPIKIALVIDSSGSMGPVIENVKQAAIKFADATPSNAEVAVFSFSDEVVQKQGFTAKERIQLVKNAITDITARKAGEGDTCLYKAAFQAVNAFTNDPKANPEERHAVVLFTDGKDREAGGKACGDMQAQNVIGQANLADRIPIQIHTIGLCEQAGCANVDQGALNNLARSTFALSKVGGVGALDTLFQTILQGLDSQWFARSNVLAIQGKNRATLNFSATVQNAARDFSIPTDEF